MLSMSLINSFFPSLSYGPEITPEQHSIGAVVCLLCCFVGILTKSYMWSCRWNPHKRNIFWVSVKFQVKIVSKADDFQNQAQPLGDLARRLKSHVTFFDIVELYIGSSIYMDSIWQQTMPHQSSNE